MYRPKWIQPVLCKLTVHIILLCNSPGGVGGGGGKHAGYTSRGKAMGGEKRSEKMRLKRMSGGEEEGRGGWETRGMGEEERVGGEERTGEERRRWEEGKGEERLGGEEGRVEHRKERRSEERKGVEVRS